MKKIKNAATVLIAVILIGGPRVRADDVRGIQLSLIPDIALEPSDTRIRGLTLNFLCGENPTEGLTLGGLINISKSHSSGFTLGPINVADSYSGVHWGVVNYSGERFAGWQVGLLNASGGPCDGWQLGAVNISDNLQGLQWGVFNYTAGESYGCQYGIINFSVGSFQGFQFGALNMAENFNGFQLGVINYTTSHMRGVQLGAINVISDVPWFSGLPHTGPAPAWPFLNWSF